MGINLDTELETDSGAEKHPFLLCQVSLLKRLKFDCRWLNLEHVPVILFQCKEANCFEFFKKKSMIICFAGGRSGKMAQIIIRELFAASNSFTLRETQRMKGKWGWMSPLST